MLNRMCTLDFQVCALGKSSTLGNFIGNLKEKTLWPH